MRIITLTVTVTKYTVNRDKTGKVNKASQGAQLLSQP